MPKITIERFAQILLTKIASGIEYFTGNKTGNVYHVSYNPKKCKWYLEVNGSRRYIRVSSKAIANTIWDIEMKAWIGGEYYANQQSEYHTGFEK